MFLTSPTSKFTPNAKTHAFHNVYTHLLQPQQSVVPQDDRPGPDEGVKGIEMEGDFEGEMEDIPPNNDSDSEDLQGEQDQERLQQEMGEVGDAGETVDKRLWGEEDKPEEGQQGPEKKEKDSSVQVGISLSS